MGAHSVLFTRRNHGSSSLAPKFGHRHNLPTRTASRLIDTIQPVSARASGVPTWGESILTCGTTLAWDPGLSTDWPQQDRRPAQQARRTASDLLAATVVSCQADAGDEWHSLHTKHSGPVGWQSSAPRRTHNPIRTYSLSFGTAPLYTVCRAGDATVRKIPRRSASASLLNASPLISPAFKLQTLAAELRFQPIDHRNGVAR